MLKEKTVFVPYKKNIYAVDLTIDINGGVVELVEVNDMSLARSNNFATISKELQDRLHKEINFLDYI